MSQINKRTVTSLDRVESYVIAPFCLDNTPSLAKGTGFLLRVGSDEDQLLCLPSSPPTKKTPHKKMQELQNKKA